MMNEGLDRTTSMTQPVESSFGLYRSEHWVTELLSTTKEEFSAGIPVLRSSRGLSISASRPAALGVGRRDNTLLVAEATYFDCLLFHPHLHPAVGSLLEAALGAAARASVENGFDEATPILERGRAALLENPSAVLSDEAVNLQATIGQSVPRPVGISGSISITSEGRRFLLVAERSDAVAVNPGSWTTAIDGGVSVGSVDTFGLLDNLRREGSAELDLAEAGIIVDWQFAGLWVPPEQSLGINGQELRRSGVNFLFVADMEVERDQLFDILSQIPSHFETRNLVVVEYPFTEVQSHVRGDRNGPLLVGLPASEHLAVAAIFGGFITPDSFQDFSSKKANGSDGQEQEHWKDQSTPGNLHFSEARECSEVLDRYPELNEALEEDALYDIGEKIGDIPPSHENLAMVATIALALESASSSASVDEGASVFCAVVDRLSRNFFAGRIGMARQYFEAVWSPGFVEVASAALGSPHGIQADWGSVDLPNDGDVGGSDGITRLRKMVGLLCFCCEVWAMEEMGEADLLEFVIDEQWRLRLSDEPLASYYYARAILVETAPSQQRVSTALERVDHSLSTFSRNAWMQHTRARLLLLKPDDRSIAAASLAASTAISLDIENPYVHATTAKISLRRELYDEAIAEFEAAVELALRSGQRRATSRDLHEWQERLDELRSSHQ